jgi:histone arginine demethylase JMJD6
LPNQKKDPEQLVDHLGLTDPYFRSDELSDEAQANIRYAKSKDRSDIPTYLWSKKEWFKKDV